MTWLPGFWPITLAFIVGVATGAFGVACLWLRQLEKELVGYRRRSLREKGVSR